ncbi:MAG: NAD(P)/FAD-dependent oxidoreductase, partial [bacterium]
NLAFLPAIQYLVELDKEIDTSSAKIYLDAEKFPQGYAWIFPKSNKTANVGLVGNINSEKFEKFSTDIVKKNYGHFKILENRSGVIPFGGARFAIAKDNILLIGDAAGLADPIFLGGINQAMWSGQIAAECILNNGVELYESKIKSLPFANLNLLNARGIFYSFDNNVLNELGEVLEGKGTSYLKTFSGMIQFLGKPNLRKNCLKIFKFFSIWRKNRDYLW